MDISKASDGILTWLESTPTPHDQPPSFTLNLNLPAGEPRKGAGDEVRTQLRNLGLNVSLLDVRDGAVSVSGTPDQVRQALNFDVVTSVVGPKSLEPNYLELDYDDPSGNRGDPSGKRSGHRRPTRSTGAPTRS